MDSNVSPHVWDCGAAISQTWAARGTLYREVTPAVELEDASCVAARPLFWEVPCSTESAQTWEVNGPLYWEGTVAFCRSDAKSVEWSESVEAKGLYLIVKFLSLIWADGSSEFVHCMPLPSNSIES